ncbi:MAG: PAS domain-containing sensor histidine kinase [Desulfovibrio sp.]|uniref:PAS domain-containing sensor histidine kinase n=1 Tax=Desulfovibrio sp. 7SRBS1 TaxID=3378064 RepID=UPI003B3CADDD
MDGPFSSCSDWEKAFDLLPNLVFFIDRECRLIWANRALLKALDKPIEDIKGLGCRQILHFNNTFCEKCAPTTKGCHEFVNHQVWIENLSGWFDITAHPLEIAENNVQGTIISAFDVTNAMRVEEAFNRAEEQYRSIFDNSLEGLYQTSVTGSILRVNRAFTGIMGYDSPELFLKKVQNISEIYVYPQQRNRLLSLLRRRGRVKGFTIQVYRADGTIIWISLSGHGVFKNQEMTHLEGSIRDVSQLMKARRRLRDSETFMRAVMNGIRAAIFVIAPKTGIIVESNDEAKRLVGYLEKPLQGENFNSIAELHNAETDMETMDGLNVEATLTRPDGAMVPVYRSTLGLRYRGTIHRVEILFDTTERKTLERNLLHAQKLESIGQLAAGIAHEINTPMQYVDGNLQFLKTVHETFDKIFGSSDELKDNETLAFYRKETPKALEQAMEGVERVTTIVKAMKRFSHPGTEDKIPTDINKAVENTVTIARNEWKYTAEMVMDLAPDLPPVPCYPGDFNQAMLNILINASHAVQDVVKEGDEKGTITISTCLTGPFVRIDISDTGTGIPPDARKKIFDPFFTTKDPGKGTGQGLAITYSIIKKHKGAIDFESEMGKGTTFHIYLPLREET